MNHGYLIALIVAFAVFAIVFGIYRYRTQRTVRIRPSQKVLDLRQRLAENPEDDTSQYLLDVAEDGDLAP